MTVPARQREAAALLARLTGDDTPVETHISAVYVGATQALKLKKAVALGFLDFTRLEDRERFCRREMELNAPAAPGIYRGVYPLTRGPDGALRLGGDAPPEEWVVAMAPLDPAYFLDVVARRGGLDAALQDALADTIAGLHDALPVMTLADAPAAMVAVVRGNRDAAHASGLPAARVDAWAGRAMAEIGRIAPLLAARAAAGRVRRCHGDLHLANLVLWQGRPMPFDALEFDEALATIDTGYDLSFLLADLEARVGRPAANRVLNRYVARNGDASLLGALPLWLSLRALIRAHCIQTAHGDGLPFLTAAEAYLDRAPPRIVAVGGLPGSGKSHLARTLAPLLGAAPGALVLRSDEFRKRQHGVPPEQRLPATAYSAEAGARLYAGLFAMAAEAARAGHSVILDAAFLEPAQREDAEAAAHQAGVPFAGFWLEAPLDLLRARVAARTGDASDADAAVLEQAAARPLGSIGWARLDAAGDAATEAWRRLNLP